MAHQELGPCECGAIHFTCPRCNAHHDRDYLDGVETFRCLACGYVGHGFHPDAEIDADVGRDVREAQAVNVGLGLEPGPFPAMTQPKPFMKWAGGKAKLAPRILELLPEKIDTYYEPFIGAGAVFWALDIKRRRFATLNDWNPELINVYHMIRDLPDALIDQLSQMPIDKDYFLQLRKNASGSSVERAARTIYLNKTGFNGLYRVNKKGEFNVPWGKHKNPKLFEEANIRACSAALQGVELTIGDFEADLGTTSANDAVYFDPPYVPLSATSDFTGYTADGFTLDDQKRLATLFAYLADRGVSVVASNSDCEVVRDLYRGFEMHEVQMRRSINSKGDRRGPVGELLIVGKRVK